MTQGLLGGFAWAVLLAAIFGCNAQSDSSLTVQNETSSALREPAPSGGAEKTSASVASKVTISIAASTQEAVKEIAEQFQKQTGCDVQINAGASSALANQIKAGAPADLFLSASREWADALQEQSLAHRDLLTNRLVLVVPQGNPAGVNSPMDLLADQVRRVALAGENVPAGKYADQALASLGLTEGLSPKVVRGSDVRVSLSYVERGEAEAGIVYATDARLSSKVESVYEFPESSHDPIVYPLVLLAHGETNPAARELFEFLQSEAAIAVFENYGFAVTTANAASPSAVFSPSAEK